jgi:hypothetical protein
VSVPCSLLKVLGMPLPLLAADIGNWIGIALVVLSVLGWIVNAIKGLDPNGNPIPKREQRPNVPRPNPARPAGRDLRSEIEVFLDEVKKAQGNAPAEPRPAPRPTPAPAAARQTPPKNQGKKPQQPQKPKKSTSPQLAKTQPSRESEPSKGGRGVREHVSTYMADNRVGAEVQQHLAHRIDASVERDMSGGTVAAVTPAIGEVTRPAPHPLLAVLAKPEGMRQAILMNEILSRPRALRDSAARRA